MPAPGRSTTVLFILGVLIVPPPEPSRAQAATGPQGGSHHVFSVYYQTRESAGKWLPAVADGGTYLRSLDEAATIAAEICKRPDTLHTKIEADKVANRPRDRSMTVTRGQMTFDAETSHSGRTSSLGPHVPGRTSGVTVGPGYDMKNRDRDWVVADLTAVGISRARAEKYAQGAGLSGDMARRFVDDHTDAALARAAAELGLTDAEVRRYVEANRLPPIEREQQRALFEKVYPTYEATVRRISNEERTVIAYGRLDWKTLDPAIYETMVDLCYQGAYTDSTRALIQQAASRNDLAAFRAAIADRDAWAGLPDVGFNEHRFKLRVNRLDEALRDREVAARVRAVNQTLSNHPAPPVVP
jgi:hypothetical protein